MSSCSASAWRRPMRTSVTLDDDSRIPTRTLVWTAGNQPSPLLRDLPCAHNRRGQLVVDADAASAGPGRRVGLGRRCAGAGRAPGGRLSPANRAARDPPGQDRGRQRDGRRAWASAAAIQLPRRRIAGRARVPHRRRGGGRPEVLGLPRLGHVAHDLLQQASGHGPQGSGGARLGHRPAVPGATLCLLPGPPEAVEPRAGGRDAEPSSDR